MPVAIAGMHRSGTSMVTRLLNLCGLYLGEEEDVVFSRKDNPEGFWENAKFCNTNDEILASFGGGWDIPPVLEPGWENSAHLAALNRHASEVIEEISQEPVWGWKDPRNSLTLPFWRRLIPDLKIVICLRNPVDVHRSLSHRGYASRFFSYNLWLTYYQQLIASTKPEECIITHYDSFFCDPRAELRRLADFLELDVSEERIQTASQATLTDLRHHRATVSDFCQMNVPCKVIELYKELCLRAGPMFNGLSLDEPQSPQKRASGMRIEGGSPFGVPGSRSTKRF